MSRKPKISKSVYDLNPKVCPVCGTILSYNQKSYTCCSKSCRGTWSNKLRTERGYSTTIDTKTKISKSLIKGQYTNHKYPKRPMFCKQCVTLFSPISNSMFCSTTCQKSRFSDIGKENASNTVKRSKLEIELYILCKTHFKNVDHNIPIFNGWDADIIVHDIKLAILWNGPWHYKQMPHSNHSLSQVQNRDRIKKQEIESYGYSVLVFEDRYYTPKKAFEKIWSLVLESNQSRESL